MKWMIRISNSHQKLSVIEISTILKNKEIVWLNPLLAVINATELEIKELLRYSFSIRTVIQNPVYYTFNPDKNPELDHFRNESFQTKFTGSFMVRAFGILKNQNELKTPDIERWFGSKIFHSNPQLSVDLEHPQHRFYVYHWQSGILYGWVYREISYSEIGKRAPKESPFFGGGAMKPLLCRILVNLLYPHKAVIMDPFCGQGGILREIGDLSLFGIGIEVSSRVIREAKINNSYHKYDGVINLILGDSLKPPLRKQAIQQVVSDPPYAMQTTTKGIEPLELFTKWLAVQDKGTTAVVTLPSKMLIQINNDWEEEFAISDFVHKSLIRVARKLKKVN